MKMNKNQRIDEALSSQSKFCYEGTDVLINKLDIRDQKTLEAAERRITTLLLTIVQEQQIPDSNTLFSVEYYLSIHKKVFDHIYPFAGKIRTENISKGNTPFCRPDYILTYMISTFKQMKEDSQKIQTREDVIDFLAYYYSELNIVHPFREGNGRILREYLRQVVKYLDKRLKEGYELDYSKNTEENRVNLINGSIVSAITGKLDLLKNFFSNSLKNLDMDKNLKGNTSIKI